MPCCMGIYLFTFVLYIYFVGFSLSFQNVYDVYYSISSQQLLHFFYSPLLLLLQRIKTKGTDNIKEKVITISLNNYMFAYH